MSPSAKFRYLRCVIFSFSGSHFAFVLQRELYKECPCKLFVSFELYGRTAPFSTSSLGCTQMYWIPKSSPGYRASSLAVIPPPATRTLYFPHHQAKVYSDDITFRPSHAQESPFPWSLYIYTDMLKELAGHKHKHSVPKRCVCVCLYSVIIGKKTCYMSVLLHMLNRCQMLQGTAIHKNFVLYTEGRFCEMNQIFPYDSDTRSYC
jgi:hypothetical protein